jgi:thiol-disulfide isomerase/thioredoxin
MAAGLARVAVVALVAAGCAHTPPDAAPPPSSASPLLGGATPTFRRETLRGERFDAAGQAGRVMIVDFFAGYCVPCRRALPSLEALHRRRPELAIVGVSLDASASGAAALVAQYGLSFPVVHDAGGVLAGRFRVTELPASFVIQGGQVVWAGGGDQPAGALVRAAEAVLRGPTTVARR